MAGIVALHITLLLGNPGNGELNSSLVIYPLHCVTRVTNVGVRLQSSLYIDDFCWEKGEINQFHMFLCR